MPAGKLGRQRGQFVRLFQEKIKSTETGKPGVFGRLRWSKSPVKSSSSGGGQQDSEIRPIDDLLVLCFRQGLNIFDSLHRQRNPNELNLFLEGLVYTNPHVVVLYAYSDSADAGGVRKKVGSYSWSSTKKTTAQENKRSEEWRKGRGQWSKDLEKQIEVVKNSANVTGGGGTRTPNTTPLTSPAMPTPRTPTARRDPQSPDNGNVFPQGSPTGSLQGLQPDDDQGRCSVGPGAGFLLGLLAVAAIVVILLIGCKICSLGGKTDNPGAGRFSESSTSNSSSSSSSASSSDSDSDSSDEK